MAFPICVDCRYKSKTTGRTYPGGKVEHGQPSLPSRSRTDGRRKKEGSFVLFCRFLQERARRPGARTRVARSSAARPCSPAAAVRMAEGGRKRVSYVCIFLQESTPCRSIEMKHLSIFTIKQSLLVANSALLSSGTPTN